MEENEDKKPEGVEPEVPEGTEEKPVEGEGEQPKEKGGKLDAIKGKAKAVKDKAKEKAKVVKQKTGEFMGVKRNRIIVLACSGAAIVALVVGLSVGLTQCHSNGGDNTSSSNSNSESKGGEGGSSSAHTHEYGTSWKSDATQHWHECACGDKKDAANHNFGSEMEIITPANETTAGKKAYKCSVCSYLKDEVAYTPYISEANFADAFKFSGDKYTATVALDAEGGEWQKTIKNGNTIHLASSRGDSQERYFTKEGSGDAAKYYYFAKNDSGTWIRYEDASKNYETLASFDANRSAFDSKLTYSGLAFGKEKLGYTGSYVNNQGTTVRVELYFDNGKITNGTKSYGEKSYTYTFSSDAAAIALPTYEAHVHQFGTAWETKKKATSSEKGIKAHKCSLCGAYDEATQKEYDPFIADTKWASALKVDSDFKLRKDSYYHYTPIHENTHEVTVQIRNGDHLKVTNDKYSYGDGFYYGGSVNWYNKIDNDDPVYGFECMKYTYDETSAQWSAVGNYQVEWVEYYGVIDWTSFAFADFTFDESEECYKKSVRTEGNQLTETESLYFDSGKLIKRVHTNKYDFGETKTEVYEIEYTTESLPLPGVGNHHTHEWPASYSSDSLYHWHECSCGAKKDKAAHDLGEYQVTKAATKTASGTKSAACSTCSGGSGEREYNPYMDGFDWSTIFNQYFAPYRMTMTTVDTNGARVTEKAFDGVTYKVSTWSTADAAGEGAKQNEDTHYYLSGYVISVDGGQWVKSTDPELNWSSHQMSDFYIYGNGDKNSKDKFDLVENGSDVHYARKDGVVDLYFDKGRIVKLHDASDSTTIVVEYDDIYEIGLPEIGSAV